IPEGVGRSRPAMYMAFQTMMGGLGLCILWSLIGAAQSGVITSKHVDFWLAERPFAFSAAFAVHMIIGGFCLWVAAGCNPGELFDLLGLPHRWGADAETAGST